jgi:hypothetical protein
LTATGSTGSTIAAPVSKRCLVGLERNGGGLDGRARLFGELRGAHQHGVADRVEHWHLAAVGEVETAAPAFERGTDEEGAGELLGAPSASFVPRVAGRVRVAGANLCLFAQGEGRIINDRAQHNVDVAGA